MDPQTDSSFFDEDPLSLSIKKEIKHETERTEHLIAPVAMTDDKPTTSRQSLDPQTSDSVLEENPLSLPINSVQEELSFVHFSKTDDGLTIFKQSMDAQTDSSFFDEDPLSLSIKKEIKHETERTEHLIAPVAMTDDKPTTSRQDLIEEVINDVEERITESSLQRSKCVVCNKLKYKCICDYVIDEEYEDFSSFSFKEKCLQITEKPVKERNVISSHLPIHTCVFCQESFTQEIYITVTLIYSCCQKKLKM
ncbi:uncharacterized protein LOC142331171 [Lycorma delicatula]|uniref:uncharacterized protein LOC142331171 n=1 Tax=Lycorma delicatula TaxID=130591 RepID=UPI003F51076F